MDPEKHEGKWQLVREEGFPPSCQGKIIGPWSVFTLCKMQVTLKVAFDLQHPEYLHTLDSNTKERHGPVAFDSRK